MIRIKRSYQDFIQLTTDKALQIFVGESRSDFYNLLALDEKIVYECYLAKDGGPDQIDFEDNYLSSITAKKADNPEWDEFVTSFPNENQELHVYKRGMVTVLEVLVTYTSPAKRQIQSIVKTRY